MREGGTITKSLFSLLWSILGQLILAIFITIGLQGLNPYCIPLFTKIGFTIPEDSTYGTLLETVITVGGVFIGLYYAAISTISGAIYARLPNDIRDLLAKEQVGNVYMRLLAFLTSFGVCLLAFHTVGFEPIILAIPLLIIGAGVMIIGFVRLGARAFYFFDPTILSQCLFKQLFRCHRQVQAGGYRWFDRSFQNHAHRRAQTTIDTLTTVSEIAAKEPHLNGRSFAGLCKNLLVFLCDYEMIKKSIPTDSLWYGEKFVHPDWYRVDHTKTTLAYETATGLRPESVGDPRWIESAILPIVSHCMEINLEEKRYPIVIELLNRLDIYVRLLATEHQIEYAFNLISDIFSWCEKLIFAVEDKLVTEEPLEHMQICAQLAMMPINVLLSYISTIKSHKRDAILQRIHHIKWRSERSIYRTGFAVYVLERLEWLRPKLAFEDRVEGYVISASWYLQELIVQKEVENLYTALISFCEKACELYKHWIEIARSSRHPWLEAMIVSEELEYLNKFDHHMDTLNDFWSDLNSDRRIEGIPWPSLDIDELMEKRRQRHKELLKIMSEKNLLLSLISRPESYPDFAGEFLHTVGEALFVAMVENDCDLIETLFGDYFGGSLLQFDKLRSEELETDWQNLNNLKIAAAPLLDLMDMSGYVYLLSDYHETPRLKETIVKAWDKYLSEEKESQRLQSLAAATSLSESGFEIEHRSINRTRWKQMIERLLANVERQEIPPNPNRITVDPEPDTVPVHKSALVRIFAGRSQPFPYMPYDGIDLFLTKYVRRREGGENLDFGWKRRRDLEKDIRWEENRDTRNGEP
ncbi:hypothetical protein C6497_02930 [Candidatus Poribacteria bacterium]|nr:MAG: hypothetical protein C6497_02930 [Candidatus Poribacteria bacterium]